MSTSDALLSTLEVRKSIYALTDKSTISDARIKEIVESAVKHCPSSFNVQSTRAVILLNDQHKQLWDMADALLKKSLPEAAYQSLARQIAGFKAAYGSVLWFEDQESLDTLKQKHKSIQHLVSEWSDHTAGIHQFVVWTAFALEGLGANLQHYNFNPEFAQDVLTTFKLPQAWKLKAQLVFGTPANGMTRLRERTYEPLDKRVLVID